RWMQYGAFCPITRAHGMDYQHQEPWGYGEEAEDICTRYIQLRYKLLPYIYTLAYQNYESGLPLARPLFFDYPDDNNLFDESSSYLWGETILVTPVVQEGQTSKSVYLPEGKWIYFWTDEVFNGRQNVTVETPLDKIPLFIKAGSIIPMQPVMNYTDEKILDTLMLEIYPSPERDARFTLYEDDGKTLEYQSGRFAQTLFVEYLKYEERTISLTINISSTQGTYDGKPLNRVYLSSIHCVLEGPAAVWKNGDAVLAMPSYQALRQGGDGYFYDRLARCLYIQTPAFSDSTYTLIVDDIIIDSDLSPSFNVVFLEQNYPNPFSSTTTIRYSIPYVAVISIKLYDLLGREIATLVDELKEPGEHEVELDLNTYGLKNLSSGVYFMRLLTGSRSLSKKLIILK
ncbi:DUF5110 domain-containing protein, partial [candidate division WOR-3 bacterium]|nr:DUF5110 domain-containing protein [candidate division WOR-3 bacterium]